MDQKQKTTIKSLINKFHLIFKIYLVLGFTRETEPIGHTHTHTQIYCEELAHTMMKAEKGHNLPSAVRRPRKASGIIPV